MLRSPRRTWQLRHAVLWAAPACLLLACGPRQTFGEVELQLRSAGRADWSPDFGVAAYSPEDSLRESATVVALSIVADKGSKASCWTRDTAFSVEVDSTESLWIGLPSWMRLGRGDRVQLIENDVVLAVEVSVPDEQSWRDWFEERVHDTRNQDGAVGHWILLPPDRIPGQVVWICPD